MIVGTAGHIDHGKTALVRALTGVETDRLAEERKRGISIDLGFAYHELPDGSVIGFVDVPGHERFMKNMLAGASGIDFVMLVVAADDGVMPQTREHLAVVGLLGITRGLVALTKCDLAARERQAAVEAEVRDLIAPGPLAEAAILRTSVMTGGGVRELREQLALAAAAFTPPPADGALRFAVDRSFTLHGSGTIVTGVVVSGSVAVGETLTISPSGRTARVRALHVQNRPAQQARRGDRCGINLGRIESSEVQRGDFLLAPELHAPTDRLDAELLLLPDAPQPLRHWRAVRLHHAAAEVQARAALLRDDPIAPGERGRIQLVLDQPIAAATGDRFVLRDGEGRRTLGGGRILDLRPPKRRRKQPRRLAQLDAMALPGPAGSLAAQLDRWPWVVDRAAFLRDRALDPARAEAVLARVAHRETSAGGAPFLFGEAVWKRLQTSARDELRSFHLRYPQLLGLNLQRLTAAIDPRLPKLAAEAALAGMVEDGILVREGGLYRLPDHRLGLDRDDSAIWQELHPLLGGDSRFRPPLLAQVVAATGRRASEIRRVLKAMARQDEVIEIAPDYFVLRGTMREVAGIVRELAEAAPDRHFAAAQLRDRLANGRKVSIRMLEYFDRQGLTLRHGDVRTINPRRLEPFRADQTIEAA